MQELTKIILWRMCPYCHVMAGAWCRSPKSGKRARYLHAARGEQVYAAWRFGYWQARRDAPEDLADRLNEAGHPGDLLDRHEVIRWLRDCGTQTRERGHG